MHTVGGEWCRAGLGASGHSSRGEGGSGSTTASLAAEKALASVALGQSSPTHSASATSPVFSLGTWVTLLSGRHTWFLQMVDQFIA